MKHHMHLNREAFLRIKSGRKIIEVRCNDEKRQKIQIGDLIEFKSLGGISESLVVEVTGKSVFSNFRDLYSSFHYSLFGHPHGTTLKNQLDSVYEDYTKDKEKKYGSLGIHIQLIKKI